MTSVLLVCTGNVCRSPAAERALALLVDGSVRVASAGTHALVDSPIEVTMAALLRESGRDVEGFAARQLSTADVHEADLVLTATPDHRREVVTATPTALRRTFTLREFAALIEGRTPDGGDDAERLTALVRTAPQRRARLPHASTLAIDDPYRRGREAHARALAEIDEAVTTIVEALHHDR